ncbi:MAG: hypothetical protein V4547_00060 [Bacteroidota bacterium]
MTAILQCITLLTLTFSSFAASAQSKTECIDESCILHFDSTLNRSYYQVAEIMPTYRGGQDTLIATIRRNLRWPGGDCCISGTVYVGFIIEPDGKVTSLRVLRSFLPNDKICDVNKEALKVTDYLTDWIAGQCNGKNVPVYLALPIKFVMQ